MAIYPNSNLPTASQPWGRAIQAKVELVDAQFLTERTNNAARDAQLQASYTRLDATSLQTIQAVAEAQAAATTANNAITGLTSLGSAGSLYDIYGDNITGGTITGGSLVTAGTRHVSVSGTNVAFFDESGNPTGSISGSGADRASAVQMVSSSATGVYAYNGGADLVGPGTLISAGNSGNANVKIYSSSSISLEGAVSIDGSAGITGLLSTAAISATGIVNYPGGTTSGNIKYTGYGSLASGTSLVLGSSATGYTIGIVASSRRFKENIQPIEDVSYVDKISQLTPVTFNFKANPAESSFGLIAEDVNAAGLTGMVNNDLDDDGNSVPFSLSYDRLAVYMIPAIKELNERIKLLEGK